MGTRLAKFEVGTLEGELVHDGPKYQARDNLRRISASLTRWGIHELTGHRLSVNHPNPVTMNSIHWV